MFPFLRNMRQGDGALERDREVQLMRLAASHHLMDAGHSFLLIKVVASALGGRTQELRAS
jgi:hypothetical protein